MAIRKITVTEEDLQNAFAELKDEYYLTRSCLVAQAARREFGYGVRVGISSIEILDPITGFAKLEDRWYMDEIGKGLTASFDYRTLEDLMLPVTFSVFQYDGPLTI